MWAIAGGRGAAAAAAGACTLQLGARCTLLPARALHADQHAYSHPHAPAPPLQVISTSGDTHLGGEDFDQVGLGQMLRGDGSSSIRGAVCCRALLPASPSNHSPPRPYPHPWSHWPGSPPPAFNPASPPPCCGLAVLQRVMEYFIKLVKRKYKKDVSTDSRALQVPRWYCSQLTLGCGGGGPGYKLPGVES